MWRRITCAFLVSWLLLCLFACSWEVRDSNLAGTYRATTDWGSSTLILKADHTFAQSVTTKAGEARKIEGKWALNTSGPSNLITFLPYLWVSHEKRGERADAGYCSVDRTLFGGVEISADPDYGIAFRR
jgi:hypothetical protein